MYCPLGSGQDCPRPTPGEMGAPPSAPHPRPLLLSPAGPPSRPAQRATAGVAVPLSSQTAAAVAAGAGPFRRAEPILVAATNGKAAFSAGDPNFAARSLALKKKRGKKSGGERRGCCTARREGSVPPVPAPCERTASPWSPRARRSPLPGGSRTRGAEARRGVGPCRVAAALGAGQPLAEPPPRSQPPCVLRAGTCRRCPAGPPAGRGGSGLAPPASTGGFPGPALHAPGRLSRRRLPSAPVPAGAPGEGAPRWPCCEGPGPRRRPRPPRCP